MELQEELAAVRREVVLPAPREQVWAELPAWIAEEAEREQRVVEIEEVQEARRLALSWCAPGGSPSVVDIVLEDDEEGGTRMVVVELPLARLRAVAPQVQAALPRGPLACV